MILPRQYWLVHLHPLGRTRITWNPCRFHTKVSLVVGLLFICRAFIGGSSLLTARFVRAGWRKKAKFHPTSRCIFQPWRWNECSKFKRLLNVVTRVQACKFVCPMSDMSFCPCLSCFFLWALKKWLCRSIIYRSTEYRLKLLIERGMFVKSESPNLLSYRPIIPSEIGHSIAPWSLIVGHWEPIARLLADLRCILTIFNALRSLPVADHPAS
jgi:hypothetical protein